MTNYPAAGAAFLDEKVPDWAEQINLVQLNIATLHDCPLGQLYGNYYEGLRKLGLDQDRDPDRYGFRIHSSARAWDTTRQAMNQQWHDEIVRRRPGAVAAKSLLTADEKHVLTVLIAEQRENLQKVYGNSGIGGAGKLFETIFKEQALLLEQIELKLELAQ